MEYAEVHIRRANGGGEEARRIVQRPPRRDEAQGFGASPCGHAPHARASRFTSSLDGITRSVLQSTHTSNDARNDGSDRTLRSAVRSAGPSSIDKTSMIISPAATSISYRIGEHSGPTIAAHISYTINSRKIFNDHLRRQRRHCKGIDAVDHNLSG
jgi:hypothetical protein